MLLFTNLLLVYNCNYCGWGLKTLKTTHKSTIERNYNHLAIHSVCVNDDRLISLRNKESVPKPKSHFRLDHCPLHGLMYIHPIIQRSITCHWLAQPCPKACFAAPQLRNLGPADCDKHHRQKDPERQIYMREKISQNIGKDLVQE